MNYLRGGRSIPKRIVFVSKLNPAVCLKVLEREAAARPADAAWPTKISVPQGGHRFTVSTFSTGARPFYGVISPHHAGSRIEGRFGTWFWRLWTYQPQYFFALLLLALVGASAAVCSAASRLSGHLWCVWSPAGAGAFATLMGGLSAAMIALLEWAGRTADASVVAWIERALKASSERKN